MGRFQRIFIAPVPLRRRSARATRRDSGAGYRPARRDAAWPDVAVGGGRISGMEPIGVHHVSVNVTDVARRCVLHGGPRADPAFGQARLRLRRAWLDAGDQQVHLIEATRPRSRPAPGSGRRRHGSDGRRAARIGCGGDRSRWSALDFRRSSTTLRQHDRAISKRRGPHAHLTGAAGPSIA